LEAREYLRDFDDNGDNRLSFEEFEELYEDFMGDDDFDWDGGDWWNNYAQTQIGAR